MKIINSYIPMIDKSCVCHTWFVVCRLDGNVSAAVTVCTDASAGHFKSCALISSSMKHSRTHKLAPSIKIIQTNRQHFDPSPIKVSLMWQRSDFDRHVICLNAFYGLESVCR